MKFEHLNNPDTSDLYQQFIAHVSKTDEDLAEEARKGKKSTTELKIFIARNEGFSPSNINEIINNILRDEDTNKNPRKFLKNITSI